MWRNGTSRAPNAAGRETSSSFVNTWSIDAFVEEGMQPAEQDEVA
ncbi:homospermidine synthase [Paraburkholderia sp. WSM4175]